MHSGYCEVKYLFNMSWISSLVFTIYIQKYVHEILAYHATIAPIYLIRSLKVVKYIANDTFNIYNID